MTSTVRQIVVVGGNGFIGSAVCRVALARGYKVTSISSSGNPYHTAKGHTPAWVHNVDWRKGDAFNPENFKNLFPQVDGVVHTLGILLEDTEYKQAVQDGKIPQLLSSLFRSMTGDTGNPLKKGFSSAPGKVGNKNTYEAMNRDAALSVCRAFTSSSPIPEAEDLNNPRPFIYVSAEDIFRPFIPAEYIETKREAEREIERMMADNPKFRGVYIRPSLVYHAHHRPLTTPAATLLDLSATLHQKVPQGIPTPSSVVRSLGKTGLFWGSEVASGSALESIANAMVIPPIHVDHVANAICEALDSRNGVRGVVDVRRMRELIGWPEEKQKHGRGLAAL